MTHINKQIVAGVLLKDAELKVFDTSVLVKLVIGTQQTWTVNGELRSSFEKHYIDVWDELARDCFGYKEGFEVCIEGITLTRTWQDSLGNFKFGKYIRASTVSFWGFGNKRPSAEVTAD